MLTAGGGGGQGPHTYMFGVHDDRTSMMDHAEWAALTDLPAVRAAPGGGVLRTRPCIFP